MSPKACQGILRRAAARGKELPEMLKTCTGKTGDSITCLNDQGGRVMSVSKDITATLRAEEHGHQPCVMQSSGFCTEHSAKSRSVGYEEERSPTLRAGVVPEVQSCPLNRVQFHAVGGHTDENLSGSLREALGDNQTAVVRTKNIQPIAV